MRPFQRLLTNLADLFKVKTFVTLLVIIALCYKTLMDIAITSEFIMLATAIVAHYFTDKEKQSDDNEE